MYENKKILVAGALGKSGRAAAELYLELGAQVIVWDESQDPLPEHLNSSESIQDARSESEKALIEKYNPDFIVTSPGIPLTHPLFLFAEKKGIPVYGETDLAFRIMEERTGSKPLIAGITGTDGKSTTTALLAHLLNECGLKAIPCGNFGLPLSELAKKKSECYDVYVAELSSYQLEPLKFLHPEVSMILNLAEDHLDRYRSMDDYLEAKLHILNLQTEQDLMIAPPEIIGAAENYLKNRLDQKVRMKSPPEIRELIHFMLFKPVPISGFSLAGNHNLKNLSFALEALADILKRKSIEISNEVFLHALQSFKGLPHRFEDLGEKNGIRFINDSKSTTCQSMVTALESVKDAGLFLLCGGRNKGIDFSVLKKYSRQIRFFPYGEAGPEIAEIVETRSYADMKDAFSAAVESAEKAEKAVILLSPGCSSFDLYRSYLERGNHFKSLVESL
ncbi:MAG: UDP-N-acetylmuramoyl-L-alanine--D-glutamate ligase [Spirochaetia bacterium]|nr:UDP-N-acetylmuramoyl-L-alanine--D-glutamate ligase [Spirochaetia bacterium]